MVEEELEVWYCCQPDGAERPSGPLSFETEKKNPKVVHLVKHLCTHASRAPWVKGKEEKDLPGPDELEVYLSKAKFIGEKPSEFDETQPLRPGLPLASFQTTDETPLLVKGPASVAGSSSSGSSASIVSDFFQSLSVKRPHCPTYTPTHPWLRSDLPTFPSHPLVLALNLLSGHLDSRDKLSPIAQNCVEQIQKANEAGSRARIRIRGPSGSGKTKCCYDIARTTASIYLDWARKTDVDIQTVIINCTSWSLERLNYELQLIFVSRLLLRKHLVENCGFSNEDWLLYQINGLAREDGDYAQVLEPLRKILRAKFETKTSLSSVLKEDDRAVIIQDELNYLATVHPLHWKNEDGKSRPLLTPVLLHAYMSHFHCVSAGTGTIYAHKDQEHSQRLKVSSVGELDYRFGSAEVGMLALDDRRRLINRLVNDRFPKSLVEKLCCDGTRARIITHAIHSLEAGRIETTQKTVELKGKTEEEQYEEWRSAVVTDWQLEAGYAFQVFTIADENFPLIASIFIRQLLGNENCTVAEKDHLILKEHLFFFKEANSASGQYTLELTNEPLIRDAMLFHFFNNQDSRKQFFDYLLTQLEQVEESQKGKYVELWLALALCQGVKFALDKQHSIQFHASGISQNIRFLDWVHQASSSVLCPKTTLGPDALCLGSVGQETAAYLDKRFCIAEAEEKREWKPFLVAASKTTWRVVRKAPAAVDAREISSARMTTDVTLCGSTSGKGENRDRPDFLQFFRKLAAETKLLVLRLHITLPRPPESQKDSRISYTRCQTPDHELCWYEMSVLVDKNHLALFQYIKEPPQSPFEGLANYLGAKNPGKPYLTIDTLEEETRSIPTAQKRNGGKKEGKGKEKIEDEEEDDRLSQQKTKKRKKGDEDGNKRATRKKVDKPS